MGKSKMEGMTVSERLLDISDRCGFSVEICRRVLSAETDSVVESLKKGERATLIGRATLRPEMRQKIESSDDGPVLIDTIKIKSDVATSLASRFDGITEFEKSEVVEEETPGIRLRQISALM